MNPEVLEAWLRLVARAFITAACLSVGIWLVIGQDVDWDYSFISFVAGYWLK